MNLFRMKKTEASNINLSMKGELPTSLRNLFLQEMLLTIWARHKPMGLD